MNPQFMKAAIKEAEKGINNRDGGPFGAVLVQNGVIISKTHNQVIKTKDPTAHAEMLAIREASKKLGRFDLSDCEIYSVSEPCPMCFAAIHWAKIKKLYFGCSRGDAASIGFEDKYIYDVIMGTAEKRQVMISQIGRNECLSVFEKWNKKPDKIPY